MESLELTWNFKVSKEQVYQAWMNGASHSAMTGGEAHIEPVEDTSYTAWDDYITGKNLKLTEGEFIRQSWRTTEFPAGSPDSLLEINLNGRGNSCELRLFQSFIPDGQSEQYKAGWVEHYFEPMEKYFNSLK